MPAKPWKWNFGLITVYLMQYSDFLPHNVAFWRIYRPEMELPDSSNPSPYISENFYRQLLVSFKKGHRRIPTSDHRPRSLAQSLTTSVRRFAATEFFYATVDRGYFNSNCFGKRLDKLGLRHIRKISRTEWDIVRLFFGRRRRLSPLFLRQERQKLHKLRRMARISQRRSVDHFGQ